MKDSQLLEQIRRLNRAFLRPDSQAPTMIAGIRAIAAEIDSAVLVVNKDGAILSSYPGKDDIDVSLKRWVEEGSIEGDKGLLALIRSGESLFNGDSPSEATGAKKQQSGAADDKPLYSVVPITGGEKRLASLLLYHPGQPLEDSRMALAEIGAGMIGMLLLQETADREDEEVRNRDLAEGAFESLSYSEVEAIREILKNITNNESVVVASKIADSLGITRSVIVNALRKFESAGIIESRSLGMKGTFIRVKNKHALEIVASRSARMSNIR